MSGAARELLALEQDARKAAEDLCEAMGGWVVPKTEQSERVKELAYRCAARCRVAARATEAGHE